MCEGAMQCNGMPGGVEMPSSSRGHYVSGFSKQCMHLKQARNNARQETSQGSNLEKSSEVYFTQEGRSVERRRTHGTTLLALQRLEASPKVQRSPPGIYTLRLDTNRKSRYLVLPQ